jgi:hypothetical protein
MRPNFARYFENSTEEEEYFQVLGARKMQAAGVKICCECGSRETYVNKNAVNTYTNRFNAYYFPYANIPVGHNSWYFTFDPDSTLCSKCYSFYANKLVEWSGKRQWYNKRRVRYGNGKRIMMDRNYKIGICTKCHIEKNTGFFHTEKVDDSNPLEYALELCRPCAIKFGLSGNNKHPKKVPKKLIMNQGLYKARKEETKRINAWYKENSIDQWFNEVRNKAI